MVLATIFAIVKDIVVPEIEKYVREHYANTGDIPTKEQIFNNLEANTSLGIAIGEAWLNSKQ